MGRRNKTPARQPQDQMDGTDGVRADCGWMDDGWWMDEVRLRLFGHKRNTSHLFMERTL